MEQQLRTAEAATRVAQHGLALAAEGQSLAEFLAIAAHELKAPLSLLAAYLQLLTTLLAGEPTTARAHQYATTALAKVQRMTRLMMCVVHHTSFRLGPLIYLTAGQLHDTVKGKRACMLAPWTH